MGQFVLDHLGLLPKVAAYGSRIGKLVGHNHRGRKVLDIKYANLGTGVAGIGIHRGSLFHILHQALVEAGIPIRTGANVVSHSSTHLRFEDDTFEGPFDLIIVSDGARSSFREIVDPTTLCKPYPYGALWTSVENWGEAPDNQLQQVFKGTRKMVGFLPTGRLPDRNGKLISIFWSLKLDQLDQWQHEGLDAWKKEIIDLAPWTETLLSQIKGPDDFTVASYFDARCHIPFGERILLLGDAAHPMSPQLGQGASLALMDAYILADSLERERQVDTAMLTYAERRRRHVAFYRLASKYMTPAFQSDKEHLAGPRDALLPIICKVPVIAKQMELTMCGAKAGVFRSLKQEREVLTMSARSALRIQESR